MKFSKKVTNAILSIVLVLFLIAGIVQPTFAASGAEYYTTRVTDLIADAFFTQAMSEGTDATESRAVLTDTMYDYSGIPSAYKYDIISFDDSYAGYVVVGAQKRFSPVIEYSVDGGEFTWESLLYNIDPALTYIKTYYLGGVNYLIEATDADNHRAYVNPSTKVVSYSESPDQTYSNDSELDKNFAGVWEDILDSLERRGNTKKVGIGNPVASIISDPDIYTIPGAASVDYFLMSDFAGYINHCGPTAATNYFRYRYEVDGFYFGNNWNNIFATLYDLSDCDPVDGTYDTNLRSAIDTFWGTYSYTDSTWLFSNPSWADTTSAIYCGDACIILVNNHPTYGNHFVFSYGYTYVQWNNIRLRYAIVADGWNSGSRQIAYNDTWCSIIESTPYIISPNS